MRATPVTLKEEFEKNPLMVRNKKDLDRFKDWCKQLPYLPHLSDELLAFFFHSSNYDVDRCRLTIDNYLTIRTEMPEVFSNRDPMTVNTSDGSSVTQFFVLPNKTKEGYKIIFTTIKNPDASKFLLSESFKHYAMVADLDLHYNGTCEGSIFVVDFLNGGLSHLPKMNLSLVKKIVTYFQDAFPVRLVAIHFIRCPSSMDRFLGLMKPFLRKDILDKLFVHSEKNDNLTKYVPLEYLPKDIGGQAPSFDELDKQARELMQKNIQWYNEDDKLRIDENKRPKTMVPTFRKLEID